MKLYILQWKDNHQTDYDMANAFVVAAESPHQARQIVAAAKENGMDGPGDEGAAFWLDASKSTCQELKPESMVPRVVLRDFRAG